MTNIVIPVFLFEIILVNILEQKLQHFTVKFIRVIIIPRRNFVLLFLTYLFFTYPETIETQPMTKTANIIARSVSAIKNSPSKTFVSASASSS